ncbi:MAG: tRNA (N6-threonylcarbamoyladenosine(37)-N6)-methyltransferase TrmO [Deltaproteobacteria bacterium]|nr:MAG: tRNA (N6-threonylcarbamoyladenosine(37)-N6)-methyltransferase TrmO [Deltaproteobacteria bacterium]
MSDTTRPPTDELTPEVDELTPEVDELTHDVEALRLRRIGTIHTPFADAVGTPIQSVYGDDAAGHVTIEPSFRGALADLDGFERIWLLYVFHRSKGWKPRLTPFRDTVERGLFATRAPRRPNPLGISLVRLHRVDLETGRLEVRDVDLIDGTPLVDIKPYIPEFDARPDSRAGWFDARRTARVVADDRFSRDES